MEEAHYCCIGGSLIGTVLTSVLATKIPQSKFQIVDLNTDLVASLNASNSQFLTQEPGLQNLLDSVKSRNLSIHSDLKSAVRSSSMIFLAVQSPTKTMWSGNSQSIDTSLLEQAVREIKEACVGAPTQTCKIIVVACTVPVGTCAQLANILEGEQKFVILSNPEFFVEGSAVENFSNPNCVIIGGTDDSEAQIAAEKLKELYLNWVDPSKIILTNVQTAELSKFVTNSFLAQRVSSINSFSAICEKANGNIYQLREALRTDPRIGSNYLNPSPGFGGSRLYKDVQNLVELAHNLDLNPVGDYWQSVIEVNEFQRVRIVQYIWQHLNRNLTNKKVLVLGAGYKRSSNSCINSSSIKIIVELLKEKCLVNVYDPQVEKCHFLEVLKDSIKQGVQIFREEMLSTLDSTVSWVTDPYEGAANTHAIVLLNNLEAFKVLEFSRLKQTMFEPSYVFDTWNLLDHTQLKSLGFKVHVLGAPSLS